MKRSTRVCNRRIKSDTQPFQNVPMAGNVENIRKGSQQMKDTIDEIRELFATSKGHTGCYRLETLPDPWTGWVCRLGSGKFGVGIPYEGTTVNENFNDMAFYSTELVIDGEEQHLLMIDSDYEEGREQFAMLGVSLVDPGEKGRLRSEILADPLAWWKKWKELVGNSVVEKKPYAVIGEMIALCQILKKDANVRWGGPQACTRDIESGSAEYEVKSTVSRYNKVVHIPGQFQLQGQTKPVYLVFNRFEEKEDGYSINRMANILTGQYGYSSDLLEKQLKLLGYPKGKSDRDIQYALLEQCTYEVNSDFPLITPSSFANGKMPKGVVSFEYSVDLDACPECQREILDSNWEESHTLHRLMSL